MILPDVNILVHAHRADSPLHAICRSLVDAQDLGLPSAVLNGFLRLVTAGPLKPVTPTNIAIATVDEWLARPGSLLLAPGPHHWKVLSDLCRRHQVRGNGFYDAHLAALALEHDIELATLDTDFDRYTELRLRRP